MSYQLGILGGMGPLATSVLFDYIVRHTPAKKDQDHINCIILNHATLPDRTDVILHGKDDDFLDAIKDDFKLFNAIGVDAVAFPCNTGHYFFDAMQKMSHGKILNMIDITLKRCHEIGAKDVVIFATEGTVNTKIYNTYAAPYHLNVHYPTAEDQQTITDIIYEVKKSGNTYYPEMSDLLARYGNGAVVILACTELSTLSIHQDNVVDTTESLGDAIIRDHLEKRA